MSVFRTNELCEEEEVGDVCVPKLEFSSTSYQEIVQNKLVRDINTNCLINITLLVKLTGNDPEPS